MSHRRMGNDRRFHTRPTRHSRSSPDRVEEGTMSVELSCAARRHIRKLIFRSDR